MKIGHYEVHDELARGGMGVVYRATDSRSGAQVVLKLLRLDSPSARRRLAREADAMRRLTHPSVVTLYDAGEHEGQPYLVLPYVEGASLQDRLDREGPLPVDEVLSIAVQVGEGLQAAHALGLLHRDVKPANVLVDRRLHGQVKLTDFGLVKDTGPDREASVSLSVHGRFLGTPGYWPPEQARGALDELGPPADVYALGALLYALLSGHPPRGGATLAEVLDALERPAPRLGGAVPRWLDDLLQRTLQLEPASRPALDALLATLRRRDDPGAAPARERSASLPLLAAGAYALLAAVGVWLLWPAGDSAPDSVATPPTQAAARIATAAAKRNLGLLDEALLELERALELDPRSADARVERGKCLAELRRLPEALRELDRALELDPRHVEGLFARGFCNSKRGDYAEAVADYTRLLELEASYTQALFNRGTCNGQLGRYEEALADYGRAIELDPDEASAYLGHGQVLAALGRHAEAIEDYARSLACVPRDLEAYGSRGMSKAALGRFAEAVEDYDRALEHAPFDAFLHANRGASNLALRLPEEALADYARACELAPDDPEFWFCRAQCFFKLSRFEEALADYDRALELGLDDGLAHANLGRCKAQLGRHREALIDYDRALALGLSPEIEPLVRRYHARSAAELGDAPPPPGADRIQLLAQARGLLAGGRVAQALELLDAEVRAGAHDPRLYSLRGAAHSRLGQHPQAIEDYERALALRPDHARDRTNLGTSKAQLGRVQEALADFELAIELDPAFGFAYVNRGLVRALNGHPDAALADYDRALELGLEPEEAAIAREQRAKVLPLTTGER